MSFDCRARVLLRTAMLEIDGSGSTVDSDKTVDIFRGCVRHTVMVRFGGERLGVEFRMGLLIKDRVGDGVRALGCGLFGRIGIVKYIFCVIF